MFPMINNPKIANFKEEPLTGMEFGLGIQVTKISESKAPHAVKNKPQIKYPDPNAQYRPLFPLEKIKAKVDTTLRSVYPPRTSKYIQSR